MSVPSLAENLLDSVVFATMPKSKSATVEIYRLQQGLNPVKVLKPNDELDGEEVILGFKMPITNLFG